MSVNIDAYDICIIGGGINGCGIARDAAGRGLKVILFEKNDLGSGTSSASSKLIHGGLRYLEHYKFKLVRESLLERENLLSAAPHIVKPMQFVLPHHPELRPRWMLRAGLFLYDRLKGKSRLRGSGAIKINSELKSKYKHGFTYSDCSVDDARLVIENAMDAQTNGATIVNYGEVLNAHRTRDYWFVDFNNRGNRGRINAKVLINAAGPWLSRVTNNCLNPEEYRSTNDRIKMVQGSHIFARKWYQHNNAYLLQNDDNRIVFVIPFQNSYVIIGTTDIEYRGDPSHVKITEQEITYLCDTVNQYFDYKLTTNDIVSTYAGVRPLYDDGSDKPQETTRDYKITLDDYLPDSPMVMIYGGKLTTYRKLAESVVSKLQPWFPEMSESWTAHTKLPGGEISNKNDLKFIQSSYKFLDLELITALFDRYGANATTLLNQIDSKDGLGIHFGHGLYEIEVQYLILKEFALTANDILWRRTKLGMKFNDSEVKALTNWIANNGNCKI